MRPSPNYCPTALYRVHNNTLAYRRSLYIDYIAAVLRTQLSDVTVAADVSLAVSAVRCADDEAWPADWSVAYVRCVKS